MDSNAELPQTSTIKQIGIEVKSSGRDHEDEREKVPGLFSKNKSGTFFVDRGHVNDAAEIRPRTIRRLSGDWVREK
jgi:hypothetical protein